MVSEKPMMNFVVPSEWVEVTDPELAWLAMVSARCGRPFIPPLGLRVFESGAVDLFDREGRCVQGSLAGYLKGQRFVVVWNPQQPATNPVVYYDLRGAKMHHAVMMGAIQSDLYQSGYKKSTDHPLMRRLFEHIYDVRPDLTLDYDFLAGSSVEVDTQHALFAYKTGNANVTFRDEELLRELSANEGWVVEFA